MSFLLTDLMFKPALIFFLALLSSFGYGQCTVTASSDTIRGCAGDTVWISASGTANYYWRGNGLSCTRCDSQYVVLSTDDIISVQGLNGASFLATNGEFTAGNFGFTSGFTNNQTSVSSLGTYAVGPDASAVHPSYGAWGDHTSGTGNFMIINGDDSPTHTTAWSQTVNLPPGVQVDMYFHLINLTSPITALVVAVNGVPSSNAYYTPSTPGVWQQNQFTFTSSSTGVNQISLQVITSAVWGNDFGLDDIMFEYSCSSYDTIYLEVEDKPVLSATSVGSGIACDELCRVWTNTSNLDSLQATYWWDFGDGSPLEFAFQTNHCFTKPGTHYVWLYCQSAYGCIDSALVDSVTIERTILFDEYSVTSNTGYWSGGVYILPSPDPTLQVEYSFVNNGYIQSIDIDWGDGTTDSFGPFSNSTSFNIGHTFISFDPLNVCARVETPIGCWDSICFPVMFTPWIESPDIFSPNGDGYNDFYRPTFYAASRAVWKIYNRWGSEVFSSESVDEYWDGTFNGGDVPDGVYFVIAEAYGPNGGSPFKLQTTLTIARESK